MGTYLKECHYFGRDSSGGSFVDFLGFEGAHILWEMNLKSIVEILWFERVLSLYSDR